MRYAPSAAVLWFVVAHRHLAMYAAIDARRSGAGRHIRPECPSATLLVTELTGAGKLKADLLLRPSDDGLFTSSHRPGARTNDRPSVRTLWLIPVFPVRPDAALINQHGSMLKKHSLSRRNRARKATKRNWYGSTLQWRSPVSNKAARRRSPWGSCGRMASVSSSNFCVAIRVRLSLERYRRGSAISLILRSGRPARIPCTKRTSRR